MSVTYLLTKDALLRYESEGATDDYGHTEKTATTQATKCYYRMSKTEISDSGYREDSDLVVVVDASVDTESLIGVEIDGIEYQLAGVPVRHWNPRTQTTEYISVQVRRAA